MRIKEIITSVGDIKSLKSKVYLAHRINRCSIEIKEAINQLYSDGSLPLIELGIQAPNDGEYIEISSNDLVSNYGMSDLEALLFIDDLDKANQKEDKKELIELLGMLTNGKHRSQIIVTDELLKQVQKESPEVWENYQRIVDEENNRFQELNKDYDHIIENEI